MDQGRIMGSAAPRTRSLGIAVTWVALAVPPGGVMAQSATEPARSGSLAGVVVDASTRQPLAGAVLTLEPSPGGLILTAGRSQLVRAGRTAETGSTGEYVFDGIVAGLYRVRIERLGYRGTTIEVDVRRPMEARVSVGLDLEPIQLEPVEVTDEAQPPFRRVSGGPEEPDAARLVLERERQSVFLTGDSRALTYADVIDGVTLGETDVFRALHRFPGVATRDDYTAEVWTRGAPWSQTRVTFDELPLFNPVHAVGMFSGITPDILGAVFYHPGFRSVSNGEGAAGIVDMRSRPGGGDGEVRGAADISMATAKLQLDQRIGDKAAWIVSARRSYLGVLTGGLDWLDLDHVDLPYEFHDIAGRVDVQLDRIRSIEASGLWEQDRLYGDVEGILEGTAANWGNAAARVTLNSPIGEINARHSIGVSRYRSRVQESGDSTTDGRPGPWVEPEADNRVSHVRLVTELEPRTTKGRPPSWSAGYEVILQDTYYDGPEPRFHPVRPDTTVRVFRDDHLWTAGAWAEVRLAAGDRLTILPGLRVDGGTGIAEPGGRADGAARTRERGTNTIHVAPRLAVRLSLTSDLSVSASAGRSWQYLQAIALAGPSAHPVFHASQFWLLAGEAAPAIRADIGTVGIEQWFGHGWLGSINAYVRSSTGLAVPDPRPGPLEGRPLFVPGNNDARGIEFGVRRVAGRWTGSLNYTRAKSEIEAAKLTYAAPTDRRDRVDAMTAVRVGGGLRVGAAYTAMSGAPYTRVKGRIRTADCELFGFGCTGPAGIVEEPNSRRTPAYRSLDLIGTLTRVLRGVEASVYLQVRNVLGRDNAVTYSGSVYDVTHNPRTVDEVIWRDRFEAGLPRLPLIGARITF